MNNTSRRNFGKQLAGAIAALPVTALVATAQKRTPPKAGGRGRGRRPDEGSPITVGGGGGIGRKDRKTLNDGVWCEFNHNDYLEPAGGPGTKKFKHQGWQMRELWVRLPEGTVDLSDVLASSTDVKCDVTVKCHGFGNNLKISAKDLGIEFNTSKFPVTSNPNRHQKPDTYITKLEIDARPIFYLEREFNPEDPWMIRVNYLRT